MGKINKRSGKLYFDFRYLGLRCREQTLLPSSSSNRIKLEKILEKIEIEIKLGTFCYQQYFPDSPRVKLFLKADKEAMALKERLLANHQYYQAEKALQGNETPAQEEIPLFEAFADIWFEENLIRWKVSYQETVRNYLYHHIVPYFGGNSINEINKTQIIQFRLHLTQKKIEKPLSNEFINHVMTSLRILMLDASERFDFDTPFKNIKPLKIERTEVNPFTLKEVMQIIDAVPSYYRNYYIVRFFTGLRTAEIDGLKWEYVDFDNQKIAIRRAWVNGREESLKNASSVREIVLSSFVQHALESQFKQTGKGIYVFCNKSGNPLCHRNIRDRVWKPTLEKLGLKYRRPYESRHTAATLWLASGESPEWIARQMGHSTTKMLFEVYSRYVPNLKRKDGSAFEEFLNQNKQ